MSKCKCSLHKALVGDGCRYCNPDLYFALLEERIRDDEAEIAALEKKLAEVTEQKGALHQSRVAPKHPDETRDETALRYRDVLTAAGKEYAKHTNAINDENVTQLFLKMRGEEEK
jgi:phage-related minor tail protein